MKRLFVGIVIHRDLRNSHLGKIAYLALEALQAEDGLRAYHARVGGRSARKQDSEDMAYSEAPLLNGE